ncbi:MAG TPA: acylneuraminate cytidylyltransferase family protein [Bacteroidales bacterium]|nr:acylneuraminate cytidylyltransferase family protein [Bacteroidales bacterium]
MKVVAFVPIKLNNERLPNKNTLPFTNGQPMVCYILETLIKIEQIDEVYVYCSSEKIKDYLPEGVKYLTRDKKLDTSHVSFNDVLSSFAHDVSADIYVLAHATAPFINKDSIIKAVEAVKSKEFDSSFGCHRLEEFLWKDSKPLNYDLENIPRTQDLEEVYAETCGLYVYTRELIVEKNRRIGYSPKIIELSRIESVDVNNEFDFTVADAVYNKYIRSDI